MSTFFVFSDESGDYKAKRDENYIKKNPFYVRSALIIDSSEWRNLSETYRDLKKLYNLPQVREIKWEYLWEVWLHENKGIKLPKECDFLEHYKYTDLENFVENSLSLLYKLNYKKIIITITSNDFNDFNISMPKNDLLKFHIQDIMERVEFELNTCQDHLAVIFIDNVNQDTDKYLRQIYFKFYTNEEFIKNYSHIKDSLNIEYSHHSAGIQFADFIAGCSLGFLKHIFSNKDYEFSRRLFKNNIFPYLRKKDGKLYGVGIKETPQNDNFRNKLMTKIGSEIPEAQFLK